MPSWTYFTAYLDGSREITQNERDELFDNLQTLLTGDCADGGYSLDATELTAVKDSRLMTDRARLNGPSSSVTRDRLQTLVATAAAAFSNYSVAEAAALSDEGITSTERDDIIAANIDDHRLWNYYKRLIDLLECSGCSLGFLDAVGKGGLYARHGYEAFDGSGRRFRTVVSRGWGGIGPGLTGPIFNDAQCSYLYGFALALVEFFGSLLSRAWNPIATYPWVDLVEDEDPLSEVTECSDGIFDFDSEEYDADFHEAFEFPDYEVHEVLQPGPRGATHLANEFDDDDVFQELREYVRGLDWPEDYARCWTGAENVGICSANQLRARHYAADPSSAIYVTSEQVRYRRRFPVPPDGQTIRFEWDIYFTPDGGSRTLFDTVSWQWDGVVPEDYDAGDPDTWPATDWFELPDYVEGLGYGAFDIGNSDWRVECGEEEAADAPTELEAFSP